MHQRIPPLPPSVLEPDQRQLYDEIATGPRAQGPQHFPLTDDDGALRGPFNAFLLSPAIGRAYQQVGAAIRFGAALEPREVELAILLVATSWHSAFERESHEAVGRAAGLTGAEVAALRIGDPGAFDGRERLVADVVLGLLAGDLDDGLYQRAVDGLGETGVFDLTALVGYYAAIALQLRVFRVDGYGFTR